jgi:hypothetical protein
VNAHVGIDFALPPVGCFSALSERNSSPGKSSPLPDWYAIDVNHLHGARLIAADGHGDWTYLVKNDCDLSYFQRYQPIARAGYSIYIYHISFDDMTRP